MPGIFDLKPPRVRFEMREVEDRNESIKQGRKVYRNEAWALINPPGSKDEVERKADEWIKNMQDTINRYGDDPERLMFHQRLLESVENGYEKWKKGQVIPEYGTPIRTSLMFSASEQRAILNANILTLEELSECNEQALAMIGMGGRELKQRAVTALAASKDVGKVAAENEALKAKLSDALDRIKALEDAGFKSDTPAPVQKRRGRPPKAVPQDMVT